jgi:YidC/Oxa1 family membrane protein insertase
MRFAVTFLAILIGLAVILGAWSNAQKTNAPKDTAAIVADEAPPEALDNADGAADPQPTAQAPDEPDEPSDEAAAEPANEAATDSAAAPVLPEVAEVAEPDLPAIPGLHVVLIDQARPAVIGFDDPRSPFKVRIELTRFGAAVWKITLSDYLKSVGKPDHYVVHDRLTLPDPKDKADPPRQIPYEYAYAARSITVNGETIPLKNNNAWLAGEVVTTEKLSWVEYTATLADADDRPVLKIVRRYTVKADSYDLSLDQHLVNLTDTPLTVRWEQNLQGDLVNDSGYLGDKRKFVAGYFALWWDTQRELIETKGAEVTRSAAVGSKGKQVWPPRGLNPKAELAWLASLNRYFAVVTHASIDDTVTETADIPPLQTIFPHIDQTVHVMAVDKPTDSQKVMVLRAATDELTLKPGGQIDLDLGIFAGPRQPELFDTPPYSTLHLDKTIVYSLGGPCSFFTFQWLAHLLLWLLKLFEGQVLVLGGLGIGVHDWGLSIILLVLIVRLLLHPLTKRAQINMMKMGKMSQALQPEIEKIKKKYKDDQSKIGAETMKLYREKGMNPANVLGCLPMFLQTPIWIALYAMLYFAIELRHEPAFWGFFQWVSGGSWRFLADLSQADNFIRIAENPVKLNLYFIHPEFQAINILPLLMGIVFYFQQKLTTPPPANEQAAQTQKMMKYMIFLFPLLLYSAPSGLTLYILASTAAGIVDSTIVRRHIKQQEESGELFKPRPAKPVKPGGFRDRISKAVEAKQQQLAQQQNQHKGGSHKPRKRR